MENAPKHFELSYEDKNSPLWSRISTHLNNEINSLRDRNDSLEISEREADQVRGMIAAYKDLLNK